MSPTGNPPTSLVTISYTESGFHPQALSATRGQRIRFINMTQAPLIVIVGSQQSPALAPGQSWDFTPTQAGTYEFSSPSGASGEVLVQ